jgi:MazG family protein
MSDATGREAGEEFLKLLGVVRELRQRCPWDREQTLASLSRHVVEEAYEAADAIERGESRNIADELGDLIAQVLSIAIIAEEENRFDIGQALAEAREKLIRRHPHVYGQVQAATAGQVLENWKRMKQEERRQTGAKSALDGLARALPALMRAERLGERAREAGMDWPDIHAVLGKVREELDEVESALERNDEKAAAEELGDMMLALANAPRFLKHDAEETLRRAIDKFIGRFEMVEQIAAERKLDLRALGAEEVEALWQESKTKSPRPG